MGPVRAAWGRGKAWGRVGLSRVEYHGTDAQASLGRVGPVRAAWGRGKVAWGGVGLSRVEYHATDAEASLTSGRRPSGVGGYPHPAGRISFRLEFPASAPSVKCSSSRQPRQSLSSLSCDHPCKPGSPNSVCCRP